MPRNRRPVDREEKRAEVIDSATALFTTQGYDETSMAAIARGAGVTPTTIYWYFQDKDELLVAVLDRILEAALTDFARRTREPWSEQLLWALDQLAHHHRLITVVHARAAHSTSIDTWHRAFHDLVDQVVADALRARGVPETDLAPLTTITTFVVEGLLTHPHDPEARRRVLDALAGLG